MDKKNIIASGRKITLFTLQLIVLIGCIAYIYFIYYTDIYPNKQVKIAYEQTECKIDNAKLETTGKFIQRYRVVFLVTYVAQGAHYQQISASGHGLDHSFSTGKTSQHAMLDQFTIGSTYTCWYNPTDPQIVVLALKQTWSSSLPLFIPFIIIAVMLYYMIIAIVEFLTLVNTKRKSTKNK